MRIHRKSAAVIGANANGEHTSGTARLVARRTAVTASTTQSARLGRRMEAIIEELKVRLTKTNRKSQVTNDTKATARATESRIPRDMASANTNSRAIRHQGQTI
jgi:hypothetical protein